MSKIFNKFKKLKTRYKVLYILFAVLFLLSIILFTQSILLLKNIETLLRIIILIVIYILYFIYLFISLLFVYCKKKIKFIINNIFISLLSIVFIVIFVYINKTYNIVDNMNKKVITYSTSLVVMSDTKFVNSNEFIVGMINNEDDIEGYILPNTLIEKKKLDKIEIKYYDNYLEMLNSLYSGDINGIFVTSGYVNQFSGYDNYNNIKNETKIVYTYKEERKNKDIVTKSNKKLTEPFTILLLGVDSETDGLSENAIFNGDTMMLITFNPKTLNTTVFSIPRDTYVPISCNGNKSSKINSSAIGGATCVINTIENLIDIDIDYYVKINFKGVVNLVDVLGGISVDVPVDFCEQDSNRDYGNEICLSAGSQTLDGEEALALSRHRHSLPLGDFQRVQHQQLVVEGILQKVKTIRNVKQFYNVLDTVSNNIETNIDTDELLNLYNVGKSMLQNTDSKINIQKTYLTGYDLTMLIPGLGNVYTFQYYEESLNEIVNAMKVNLGLKYPELTKTFNFSVNEIYEVPVIGKEYYSVKRNEALPNFVGSTISYLNDWASQRNIVINVNYITSTMDGYDENKDGYITYQSVQKGTLVSSISSISVNVIKKDTIINNNNEEVIEELQTSDDNIIEEVENTNIEENNDLVDNEELEE